MEKIAVFAPMPSASDRIATTVTIGVAFNVRNAFRRSDISAATVRRALPRIGWSRSVIDLINNRQLRSAPLARWAPVAPRAHVAPWHPGHSNKQEPNLQLEGVYSVLPTPFQPNGDLDEESLRRVIDLFIGAGVNGVTALGVTGEVATARRRGAAAGAGGRRRARQRTHRRCRRHDGGRYANLHRVHPPRARRPARRQ